MTASAHSDLGGNIGIASPAAKAGFEPGDVITRAGQQTVGDPSDVQMSSIRPASPGRTMLFFYGGGMASRCSFRFR